jgi:uncharacterized small protein (DUF1192 family)
MWSCLSQFHLGRGMEPALPIGQDRFMTNPEEDLPRPARKLLVPPPLDLLGVEELRAYIGDLETEISRVKQAIAAKQAHRDAAAAFFKTPPGG